MISALIFLQCFDNVWLGDRKGVQSVKNLICNCSDLEQVEQENGRGNG